MIDKITPEFLKSIGIFELREIGREIGVHSPTTLRRDILVESILNIYQGKEKPSKKNNRGRPVKNIGNTREIVSSVKNQAELNYEFNEADKSTMVLREHVTPFDKALPEENRQCTGILDIGKEGYGMLKAENYSSGESDVYLSRSQISAFGLRRGDLIEGIANKSPEKNYNAMHTVSVVNGIPNNSLQKRKNFESLTPVYPDEKLISFENDNPPDINILSLMAPIGKGQRAVVFAPDRFKKIDLIKNLAKAIRKNSADIEILTLLLGEFPEEVTEIKRAVLGETVYTTFDEKPENNIKISELVLERAKRLTELGKDVVLLINNLNVLARAYSFKESNNTEQYSYYLIRRFFGAARNMDEGGSLSIIAFVDYNTDIAFDNALCKELKGMGNSEIYLTKENDNGIIIDIINSGTSRKELLLTEEEIECGKIIKEKVEKDYNGALKTIVPMIKDSASIKELKEYLNK